MLTVQRSGINFGKELGLGVLMLALATGTCVAASTATVSGVVRDTQGLAQMGAMVEVLAAGSASVATAFTDMYGRYRIANLVPGKYQVRATAALFVPATRGNLQLMTGMRATVNLTLSMLADPMAWLPAERRKPDEPGDDWTWTLRSSANRPILRLLDNGDMVLVSAGAPEGGHGGPLQGRVSVMSGDGGFGEGGVRSVVAVSRKTASGSDLAARTSVAKVGPQANAIPATEVDAGYESQGMFTGPSRLVLSYASHPEILSSGSEMGMQLMRMASGRQMRLGDTVDVEAGGTVYAIHTDGTALAAKPFLRVTVHPGEVWAVRYRLATSRDLQSFDAMDSLATDLPVAAMSGGRLCTEGGNHQEVSLSRKAGNGVIQAALYRDSIDHPVVSGMGSKMLGGDVAPGTVMVDTSTGSFRFFGAGYTSNGMSLTLSEPIAANWWAAVELNSGAALSARNTADERLAEVAAGLRAETAGAVTAALRGKVQRTGTWVRATYRWQPSHLVTAVDPYAVPGNQAYLSLFVRQAMRWGDRLPPGLEATIDVTNLLAEGYQPFLSADGQTLFLAQSPRTVQAGLSFTF
jgi:hypothetical protein